MPMKKDAAWWREYRAKRTQVEAGAMTEKQAADAMGLDRLTFREADFDQQLGEWIVDHLEPKGVEAVLEGIRKGSPEVWKKYKEATVDEVKKAIEPDKTKVSRGRLSKGLGELPGDAPKKDGEFKPKPSSGQK